MDEPSSQKFEPSAYENLNPPGVKSKCIYIFSREQISVDFSQNTAKQFQKSNSQFRGERAETEVGVDGSIHKSVNGYHISQALLDRKGGMP